MSISQWRNLNKPIRVGIDSFSVDVRAVAPWLGVLFSSNMIFVSLFIDLIFIFCWWKKIKVGMLIRWLRVKISGGKKHMACPSWRKRRLFTMTGLFILFGATALHQDKAMAELQLLPSDPVVSTTSHVGLPGLGAYPNQKGFGHDVKLSSVMDMLIPSTWVVRYKAAELKDVKVDFRTEGMTLEDIMSDLAVRYGLKVQYGTTSGVVLVEWNRGQCSKSRDEKTKTITLC